jgi:hypothetical protein
LRDVKRCVLANPSSVTVLEGAWAGATGYPFVSMLKYGSLFSLLFACAACGDDATAPPAVTFDAGPRRDAGPRPDGGPDAGPVDGALPDGALHDGRIPGTDGGLPSSCVVDPDADRIKLGEDTLATRRLAPITPSSTGGFAAFWASAPAGAEDVFGRIVPQEGVAPTVVNVTNDAFITRGPAVVAVGTGYLLAWFDNSTTGFEVWARPLDGALAPTASAQRITMNTSRDDQPAVIRFGTGALVAWVNDDSAGSRVAHTRILDGDASPTTAAVAVTSSPALPDSPILSVRSGGAALSWVDSRAGSAHVMLLPLDATGAAAGAAYQLDTGGDADGTLDVDLVESGGAAVFGVSVSGSRPEVRFRRLMDSGAPAGDEIPVTPAPERATSASLTRYRGGWAVAYRALSDTGLDSPMIRLALLDAGGNFVRRFDLTNAHEIGGRTTVRASADGTTLLVTWSDIALSTTSINSARVHCE